ncbi:hypothetical protein [Endothiovibrio diazotrophicus]
MSRNRLQPLLSKIDALTLREKLIVTVTLIVCAYGLTDTLLIKPLARQRAQLQELLTPKQVRNTQLAAQIQRVIHDNRDDPNAQLRNRLAKLDAEVKLLDERLKERTVDLIAPAEMTRVLQTLLGDGVELLSLDSEDPKPLIEEQKQDKALSFFGAESKAPNIYRHTMVLTVRASYLEILNFLQRLEQLPWLFSWEQLKLEVEEYPACRVTLRAHTLSLSEEWVGG